MVKIGRHNQELKGDRCGHCNGKGKIMANIGDGIFIEVDCPDCQSTGIVNSPNACTKCKGSGKVIVDIGIIKAEAICDQCNGSGLEPKQETK